MSLFHSESNSSRGPNPALTLRLLQRKEVFEAARLVGYGMSDNPANIRVFGVRDVEHRCRSLERFFVPVLNGVHLRGLILGAFLDGKLVGACGMARPGMCQPTTLEKLRVFPSVVIGNPLGTLLRVLQWAGEWARRDPAESHWHLGPVAVDPHLRGRGIGTAMLHTFCAIMDLCRSLSYLETDKLENVRFYQKFGFTVVGEVETLGIPNWFMSRPGSGISVQQGSDEAPVSSLEPRSLA
ncbi:MAG TPA: GNAT family N-acetyltransferase [Terriglobales bacterium]|nr:GNAT family N-acetyltransferase [Terriglobales bacterium]